MMKYAVIFALMVPGLCFADKKKEARKPDAIVECNSDAYEKAMGYLREKKLERRNMTHICSSIPPYYKVRFSSGKSFLIVTMDASHDFALYMPNTDNDWERGHGGGDN